MYARPRSVQTARATTNPVVRRGQSGRERGAALSHNSPPGRHHLNCDAAFSNAFFIEVQAASIPDCMCSHADSLAVRISCNLSRRDPGRLALP